jgi:hypothetical protein
LICTQNAYVISYKYVNLNVVKLAKFYEWCSLYFTIYLEFWHNYGKDYLQQIFFYLQIYVITSKACCHYYSTPNYFLFIKLVNINQICLIYSLDTDSFGLYLSKLFINFSVLSLKIIFLHSSVGNVNMNGVCFTSCSCAVYIILDIIQLCYRYLL